MALVDNTTYTGKDLEGFYSVALLQGNTKSLVSLVPNVKSKVKIGSLNLGNILQADSCSVSESGTYTLEQKTLEVCDFAVNIPLCAKDYEANYLSEQLRAGSNVPENFPDSFMGYLMKLVAERINYQTEQMFWNGDTVNSPPLCSGLIEEFLADSAVIDCSAPTILTNSNIDDELIKVVNALPDTMRDKSRTKIFISINAQALYEQFLVINTPALYAYNNADFALKFMGYDLIVSPGMPDNTMVACDPKNLWYGCDVKDEENEVRFIDDMKITGQKTARLITTFKWGVSYGNGEEIVLYGTGS